MSFYATLHNSFFMLFNMCEFILFTTFMTCILLTLLYDSLKTKIIWTGILVIVLFGCVTLSQVLSYIDFDVLVVFLSMMVLSKTLSYSKFPDYLATRIVSRVKNASTAMIIISLFTGILSIFIIDVASVLVMSSVAFTVCRRCNINPVPLLFGMILMANLGGAATMVSYPATLVFTRLAGLKFMD